MDRLREQGIDVAGFRGGMPVIDSERFVNRRAELYWMLREMFERGEADIDPDDDLLAAQLGAIKWAPDSRDRIKIESKLDMRKRGMPSPDRADAVMMTLDETASLEPVVQEEHVETMTGDLLSTAW